MQVRDERPGRKRVSVIHVKECHPFEWEGDVYLRSGTLGAVGSDVRAVNVRSTYAVSFARSTQVIPLKADLVITGVAE